MKPDIRDDKFRVVIDNDSYINYCPKILLLDDDVVDILRLFPFWERGNLLCAGGVEDQPYWYYIAMLKLNEIKLNYEASLYDSNKNF